MRTSLTLLLAVIAFSGCFTQPTRSDPLAALGGIEADGPYREVTLAVVESKNTAEAKKFLTHRLAPRFKPHQLFREIDALLDKNFKKVVRVKSLAEAPATGADMTMLLDVFTQLGGFGGLPYLDVSFIFFDLDGSKIDTIKAEGTAAAMSAWDAGGLMRKAERRVMQGLAAGLSDSEGLAAAARASEAEPAPVAKKRPARRVHSDIDIPRYSLKERPNDFALVIGVEDYLNDLPPAQFAERDAKAVRSHLRALGFPKRNIKYFTQQRAVRSAMSAYLEEWLPRNVKPDSRVFIYFSGHGAPDPTTGQAYLIPSDGHPNFLAKTAYPVKRLYAQAGALKAKQVVVALDACFSGMGGRSLLPEGARPLVTKVDASVDSGGKIVLFAAAQSNQITATLKEQGHGIFTYYLLKGLSGEAKDAQGAVTPQGLYKYLKPRVRDAANRQNRDQTPVLEGVKEGTLFQFD